jgi:hypothetical protein
MLRELQEKRPASIAMFLQRTEKHYENTNTLFGVEMAANYSWNFVFWL